MEEVRQLVQEEGREARNLVAFHVAVDTPARVARKPVRAAALSAARRAAPRPAGAGRLRSASAGRDKRSELRARYWALLFGDLQRAIGEIYNTVENHENLNECQEVILVLENYTRDFKALGEWFRLKWEYDNTPPPQRQQSLAWEIRKTDFVRPESRRAHSVKSSPSVSGKNSPCLSGHNTPSGKNSPNLTGKASPGSGKISPLVSVHSSTSPKGNIEFFSTKIASKITTKPETKSGKEAPRLSDIKERDIKDSIEDNDVVCEKDYTMLQKEKGEKDPILKTVEIGKAKECPNISPKQVIVKSPKRAIHETKLTLDSKAISNEELSSQAKSTIAKLDAMENMFLAKQLIDNAAKNDNKLNIDKEQEKNEDIIKDHINNKTDSISNITKSLEQMDEKPFAVDDKESHLSESPAKSEDNFADLSNASSSKSIDEKCHLVDSDSISSDLEVKNNITAHNIQITYCETNKKGAERITSETDTPKKEDGKELKPLTTDGQPPKEIKQVKEQELKNGDIKDDLKKEELKKPETRNIKPAYSQAAAKPKPVTPVKTEVKIPARLTNMIRSKTVVEIRPNTVPRTRRLPNRNQTSKCSYPFNLTTGRISLFDAPANKLAVKKPAHRLQIASGDTKVNQANFDAKQRPPRPSSLKVNDTGNKKEKNNPTLGNIKDCDEYGSSDTIVTQIDMSRIESSESLKTLVPEELQDTANSIEVLNVDNNKIDNEGWLTVKSRRLSRESKKQYKSHWSNRFHQPSATTSLPTLNMIESPKQESKSIVNAQLDRAKSEQPQYKPEKVVKVAAKKQESRARDPAMIRQKSDVTGLKSRSARSKALKKAEKVKEIIQNRELTKNRLHSSLESLTTGLARSQESTKETFDFDKWKAEFKFTFKYLDEDDQISNHNEILKTADPSEMSEIAEMTSQIEENERKISWALDFQSEVDQRKLCEEEDLLNRQIMELQQVSDIDMDTETDDTETDAEILCEDNTAISASAENLRCLAASLEDQYETALAGMSWAERVDTLGVLEALVARDPGRAQQLHAKLSQGIKRRGSFQDALRRLQAKQARAERQRIEYQMERAKRIHQLLARVEEVKVAKNQLIEEKRNRMERRLQKAAENRDQHLKDIVRKAHDEEEKLREIAFIKQLEAENRRHEFLDQCRSQNTRLRQMRRDRLSKLEQKAAREAAVGARRQAIEAARKLHVETLLEKRKERDARVEELKELKKQERDDAAREKAEGVKSRLSALAAAAELEADALRSRIRDKQDASQQRLESRLQAIREKALGPRQPTTSESLDPMSKEEKELEEATQKLEQERKEREKQKAIKKKARKIKQKLLSTSSDVMVKEDFQIDLHPSTKLYKVVHQLTNIVAPLLVAGNDKNHDINGLDGENNKKKGNKHKTNGVEAEGKKKNKKNKNNDNNNKGLVKTASVCSSLSDMSKGSCKSENKCRVSIDMPFLEKQLNELYRVLDRLIMSSLDKSPYQRLHGLRVLGQLLAVAAEREDLYSQFTARALTTAVQAVALAAGTCALSAAHLLASSAGVHLAQLLAHQLEKDLQSDPREMELAKQLCDCISVAIDSVLCNTRLYEKESTRDDELLATLRSRAHTLVSYICLSGCISRAEKAGEARENIQTLLTVSAELCHPCDVDVGSERASAIQSLRCALGTGVCGSRAEFCMLFAAGAGLEHSGSFVRAARTAHLLRVLAELDHQIVQEAFGEGGWPLEFRAAVARLLSQHAPNDKEAPRTKALRLCNQRLDQKLSETMVLDLIVLVGFVVVNNPQLQETICDGWSVIKTLCTLPANWLVSKDHSHALLPTLVALSDRPSAAAAIASELSVDMLEEYINSPEAQRIKLVQVIKQGRTKKGSGKK